MIHWGQFEIAINSLLIELNIYYALIFFINYIIKVKFIPLQYKDNIKL